MNIVGRRWSGFTLIELLVVVAIIGLLMSIVLPSYQAARRQSRNTKCLAQLRELLNATQIYINDEHRLPPLNNDPNDGAWQYNYLIYDGRDYDQGFGPLGQPEPDGTTKYLQLLFCPVQENLFHKLRTLQNPWPPVPESDTRAGYSRRHGLTGKDFTQFRRPIAFMADLLSLPDLIVETGHRNGVNAAYTDGHCGWVRDPGILTHNDLTKPFDPMDNPIIDNIWDMLDRRGR